MGMLDQSQDGPGPHVRISSLKRALSSGGGRIGPAVRILLTEHDLAAAGPGSLASDLVAIAEVDLSVARILEGHVNAVQLIRLLGGSAERDAVHGVWGADADPPVTADRNRLKGSKRYASGLGIVDRALVTVGSGEACRLALVDARDPARHRTDDWDMVGMQATVSGGIDLTGLVPVWLGGPGDYFREPHFLGGVWRIAALQLGGTLGLLGAARAELDSRGHLGADAQVARLGPLVGRAMAAFGLVERAARVAESPEGATDQDLAVMLSLQSRLLTEDLAQDAVAAVERSVGLSHFAADSETGRRARDLATYCRQAARDAFEQRAGRIALGRTGPLSALWHG